MALNTMQLNTISKAFAMAKKLQEDIYPVLKDLQVIYDTPTTGLKATIQQSDLDAVASFSGLTKQQLEDGMYVMTGLVAGNIESGYTQLAHLAARG